MKLFSIFALFLLFACCEVTDVPTQCFRVEFSDALPVQFWLSDCETYNETVPDGVHYKCFCHPWKCDDELKIQFTETEGDEYILLVSDSEDSELALIDFVSTPLDGSPEIPGDTSSITLPSLSTGVNIAGSGTNWTTGSNPSVTLAGGPAPATIQSDIIAWGYDFVPGYEYDFIMDIDYNFDANTVINEIHFVVMDNSNNILFEDTSPNIPPGSGTYTGPINFTAITGAVKYGVYVVSTGAFSPSSTIDIDGFTATQTTPTIPAVPTTQWMNFASLIPSDHGICEQKIKFEVINTTESPDEVVAKSDCILISDANPDPTVLIEYSNNRNFAGLVYENVSPEQTFSIRIPAVFFHERFPEEDEVAELSTSIITLNGEMRAQRLLDTAHMPYYMHRKIKLILKHQAVTVAGLAIAKQDAYEIDEGDRRWPLKKAKCWLTERDFVQRNVV
jgi:hypothetical protein